MDTPEPQTNSTEAPEESNEVKKAKLPGKLIALAIVILVFIAGILLLYKPTSTRQDASSSTGKTASSSATTINGPCGENLQFVNTKQGYQVCYPTSWQKAELQVSALTEGFGTTIPSQDFHGTFSVTVSDEPVNNRIEDITNDSSKFAYGKAALGGVNATQVTYTRLKTDPLFATYNQGIDTVLTHFGRTYLISLTTNDTNQESETKLYNDFLASWKFLDNTADPPWSSSHNILVYSPWPGDKVGKTISLSGEANAFEGVVNIRIKDKDGHVLEQTTTQTSAGNERSSFAMDVSYNTPTTKDGTIDVYTVSASNGSEQDKVTIPITFP